MLLTVPPAHLGYAPTRGGWRRRHGLLSLGVATTLAEERESKQSPRPDRQLPPVLPARSRWVAATTATARVGTPAARSVLAASATVAPVVIRSSTTSTASWSIRLMSHSVYALYTTRVPARLARRCSADSPAASASGPVGRSAGHTTTLPPSAAAVARASRSHWSPPRLRAARRRDGTGTRATARTPAAAAPPAARPAGPAPAAGPGSGPRRLRSL